MNGFILLLVCWLALYRCGLEDNTVHQYSLSGKSMFCIDPLGNYNNVTAIILHQRLWPYLRHCTTNRLKLFFVLMSYFFGFQIWKIWGFGCFCKHCVGTAWSTVHCERKVFWNSTDKQSIIYRICLIIGLSGIVWLLCWNVLFNFFLLHDSACAT